jgi:outer membrane protein assembly factor BamE (lipoprotein component of BamABCDE complex)
MNVLKASNDYSPVHCNFKSYRTMNSLVRLIALTLCILLLQSCAQYENKRGVDVTWQASVTEQLVEGKSTRGDVLTLLGPPSQVISLDDETALYYLFEHSRGEGLILIVYNRMRIDTRFDRAVFFFDNDDVLTEYSTRIHTSDDG